MAWRTPMPARRVSEVPPGVARARTSYLVCHPHPHPPPPAAPASRAGPTPCCRRARPSAPPRGPAPPAPQPAASRRRRRCSRHQPRRASEGCHAPSRPGSRRPGAGGRLGFGVRVVTGVHRGASDRESVVLSRARTLETLGSLACARPVRAPAARSPVGHPPAMRGTAGSSTRCLPADRTAPHRTAPREESEHRNTVRPHRTGTSSGDRGQDAAHLPHPPRSTHPHLGSRLHHQQPGALVRPLAGGGVQRRGARGVGQVGVSALGAGGRGGRRGRERQHGHHRQPPRQTPATPTTPWPGVAAEPSQCQGALTRAPDCWWPPVTARPYSPRRTSGRVPNRGVAREGAERNDGAPPGLQRARLRTVFSS